jgi:ABC-type nitrate/sulfonate/bicarbonate transport system permease component
VSRAFVVLGAAPSVGNGLICAIDHIPPLMLRSGRVLGARGLTLFRFVVLPAAMAAFVGGAAAAAGVSSSQVPEHRYPSPTPLVQRGCPSA